MQSITHTRVDVVSVDANAVIELLNDCFMIIHAMETFDFDDLMSLDDSSYYNITGLRKGTKKCLLHIDNLASLISIQSLAEQYHVDEKFSRSIDSCCSHGLLRQDATWYE
jgi:hypothetical protein